MHHQDPHTTAQPGENIHRLAEHLFRSESSRLMAILTSIFGPSNLQLAEDVAQEALVRALQTWPYYGVPHNPAAWLTQTAKNLALDALRRDTTFQRKTTAIAHHVEMRMGHSTASIRYPALAGDITDDTLRLIFTCCHPELPREGQTALALKTLCGFNEAEIAQAFLTTEVAIRKRLTRTRQKIRQLNLPFEIPTGEQLEPRLQGVLQVLYLLFNEGYKATTGPDLVRRSLCREAIRLTDLLSSHALVGQSQVHALLALMLFNAARLPSRTDTSGNLQLLAHQDRSTWDKAMIARAFHHLQNSTRGQNLTPYHLQAAIAAQHCAAPDYNSTDWAQILYWYDHLIALDPSPVIALNRTVAILHVHGPNQALHTIQNIPHRRRLEKYYLYHALLGHIHHRLNQPAISKNHYQKAATLTTTPAEQEFLQNQ